jgi:hypothetical protein
LPIDACTAAALSTARTAQLSKDAITREINGPAPEPLDYRENCFLNFPELPNRAFFIGTHIAL